METYKCSTCKKFFLKENLHKASKHIKKDGSIVQYYRCNPCETKNCKKYRQTETGRKNIYKAEYKSVKKHKDRQDARVLVNYKVKTGKLYKPKCCESCGISKKLEGHHWDYTKPLEVNWLCKKCHIVADRLLEEQML